MNFCFLIAPMPLIVCCCVYCHALYANRPHTGPTTKKTKKNGHADAAGRNKPQAPRCFSLEEHGYMMTVRSTDRSHFGRIRAFCLFLILRVAGPLLFSSATAGLYMRTPRDLRGVRSSTFMFFLHQGIDATLLGCVAASLIWLAPIKVGDEHGVTSDDGGPDSWVRAFALIAFYRLYGAGRAAHLVSH